jgi:hypothetical protein
MPVKPENKHKYPADWGLIVNRIRNRARNQCEWCGIPNGAIGGRMDNGTFLKAHAKGETLHGLEWPKPGEEYWCTNENHKQWLRIIKIVLTTAHLNHDEADCSDDNLRYLCQKCHLNYDQQHHLETAYQTRRQGKALADMFEQLT